MKCNGGGCMFGNCFWVEVDEGCLRYFIFYVFFEIEIYRDVFIVFRFKDFMLLFEL